MELKITQEKIERWAQEIAEKLKGFEFKTFLVGSRISKNFGLQQEEKSEINQKLRKIVAKLTKKKVDIQDPDIIAIVEPEKEKIFLQVKSLFIFGKYQKLERGIPQCRWFCPRCRGKGCPICNFTGKKYPTSIHEEMEKPFLEATGGIKTRFHGAGREDVDVRCLGKRPFIIEVVHPRKRKIDLKKIKEEINKSNKIKVFGLKIVKEGRNLIRKIKEEKLEKTYQAEVEFEEEIKKEKLKELKKLVLKPILQKTPLRVLHRRADKWRIRRVIKISWKLLSPKKLLLKIRAEGGLYIKELINGDQGRTKPNVAEILENKVNKISLDVLKIHDKLLFRRT